MSRILLGTICGLAFGVIDIGIMLPMSFPDKKAAITAARNASGLLLATLFRQAAAIR